MVGGGAVGVERSFIYNLFERVGGVDPNNTRLLGRKEIMRNEGKATGKGCSRCALGRERCALGALVMRVKRREEKKEKGCTKI